MNPNSKVSQLIERFGSKELALKCAKKVRDTIPTHMMYTKKPSPVRKKWDDVCKILES